MNKTLPSKAHSLGAALCAISYDAGLNCECRARTGRGDVTYWVPLNHLITLHLPSTLWQRLCYLRDGDQEAKALRG